MWATEVENEAGGVLGQVVSGRVNGAEGLTGVRQEGVSQGS